MRNFDGHSVLSIPLSPSCSRLFFAQAFARDRKRRDLGEGGCVDQQRRALQDAARADRVHAGVHAAAGHHRPDGERMGGRPTVC